MFIIKKRDVSVPFKDVFHGIAVSSPVRLSDGKDRSHRGFGRFRGHSRG